MAIDFHNHLIPGVDDGAQTVEESLEALERFQDDGVEAIVATPHVDASLTLEPPRLAERLAEIDAGAFGCDSATNVMMTATVKTMDSQRWVCRIQLFMTCSPVRQ